MRTIYKPIEQARVLKVAPQVRQPVLKTMLLTASTAWAGATSGLCSSTFTRPAHRRAACRSARICSPGRRGGGHGHCPPCRTPGQRAARAHNARAATCRGTAPRREHHDGDGREQRARRAAVAAQRVEELALAVEHVHEVNNGLFIFHPISNKETCFPV